MSKARALILALFLFAPAPAGAMQISEIMYDLSGTDTGREWLEVYNDSSSAVDATSFRLFENNTNHGLLLVSGTGVLQPGVVAVIADDAAKFMADNPTYGSTLFSSSFSLSNSGESLAIKDGSLNVLDSISYDSSMGAAGDGNSLVRSGLGFSSAIPSPGTLGTSSQSPQSSSQTSSTTTTQVQSQTQTGVGASVPVITVKVKADELVMVGGGSFFSASAYGSQGLPLSGARFLWNFGDGATAEGARVFHAYRYPGTYSVSVSAAYNYSSAMERLTVEAVGASVSLQAFADGSLLVRNDSKSDLDVGLWSLMQEGKVYVIPEETTVLGGEGIRFAAEVIGFLGAPSAQLRYPNEAVAASAAPSADSPSRGVRVSAAQLQAMEQPRASVVRTGQPSAPAPSVTAPSSSQGAAAATASFGVGQWGPYAGLAVVLFAGAYGTRVLYRPRRVGEETELSPDEFEIEEAKY